MKTLIFLFVLSFGLLSCTADLDIPKPDPSDDIDYSEHPRHSEFSDLLLQYRVKANAPGAVMLISRSGEPLWVGATGKSNLEHQSPMQINSQFRIGSISKVFVAVAVLQMVEANKLQMEDKLSSLVPTG
ncbi:MAG: beta-lactamase family protein [Saprospiraceae bacterium]|nr:beta-lactamase family protein [Saprospiraceae bacterium]